MQNILITSVGKRVELVKEFQEMLNRLSPGSKVLTTELNPSLSPAAHISDGCFNVPRVTAPDYIDILMMICKEQNIALIVPTIDTELLVLAKNKNLFERIGCHLLVSDLSFVTTCRDKRLTIPFFEAHGIAVPKQLSKFAPEFPMFAKPYDGSLSIDTFVIRTESDLTSYILNHPKLIFMEYIDRSQCQEYTVDLYYGKDCQIKSLVPRERLEVRAGEINKGVTRKNQIVEVLKERLGYLPGVSGCICIQLFYNPSNEQIIAFEINPRFGGGYPLSFAAGANFPEYAIREYILGEDIDYNEDWEDNTMMLRYDASVIIRNAFS